MTATRLLVTGASRGIGRALALALADDAELIVVTGRSDEQLQSLERQNPRVFQSIPCDLTDPTSRRGLIDRIGHFEAPFDGLIYCAGDGLPSPIADVEAAEIRRLFELHVVAPLELVKAVLPAMREMRRGRIIAISSLAAIRPRRFMAAYGSTKSAIRTLIKCLADEVAEDGITANLVSPGGVDTALGRQGRAMLETLEGRPEGSELKGRLHALPTHRGLTPTDLVGIVSLLLGPGGSVISGQDIVVAGTSVM